MPIAHDAPGPKALLQMVSERTFHGMIFLPFGEYELDLLRAMNIKIIAQFNKRSSDPRRPTKTAGNNHQSDALSTIVLGFPNFAFEVFRAFAHGVSKGCIAMPSGENQRYRARLVALRAYSLRVYTPSSKIFRDSSRVNPEIGSW
jgi:hypothetical protein